MVFRRINVFHEYTGRLDRWTAGGGVGVGRGYKRPDRPGRWLDDHEVAS
jgi:hypothetical protein